MKTSPRAMSLAAVFALTSAAALVSPHAADASVTGPQQSRSSAALATATTAPSSIWGGGFANVVAWGANGQTVAVGGDTSGVHISTDAGAHWTAANLGLNKDASGRKYDRHIAALAFASGSSTDLYALAGDGESGAGRVLEATLTAGVWTWNQVAGSGVSGSTVSFTTDGTNGGGNPALYGQDPRPTGHLIQSLNATTTYAMAQQDLLRVSGSTWTKRTEFSGGTIATGLSLDPNNSSSAWITARSLPNTTGSPGVYLDRAIAQASGTGVTCALPAPATVQATDNPQEIVALNQTSSSGSNNTVLYVAWGNAGLFALNFTAASPNGGCGSVAATDWVNLTPASTKCDKTVGNQLGQGWAAIDGYATAGVATVWSGCDVSNGSNANTDGLWRQTVTLDSATGKPTVTQTAPIGDQTAGHGVISNIVVGTTGSTATNWWHVDSTRTAMYIASNPEVALGHGNYLSSQIAINPTTAQRGTVLVSGKAGLWETTNGNASNASISWAPSVQGIGSTVEHGVAVNPLRPGAVLIGDTDWSLLYSNSRLSGDEPYNEHIANSASPSFGFAGLAVTTDAAATSGNAFFAAGELGNVASNTNPNTMDWTAPVSAAGGNDIVGLAVRGSTVIAASPGYGSSTRSGIRYSTDGGTTYNNATITGGGRIGVQSGNADHVNVAWNSSATTPTAYLYDNALGLLRSTNGQVWTRIITNNRYLTGSGLGGYLAVDPQSDTIYFSATPTTAGTTPGVYQLRNASTCASITACESSTNLTAVTLPSGAAWKSPGPLSVDPAGRVWITQYPTASNPSQLYEAGSAAATTVSQVNDTAFSSGAQLINAIATGTGCGGTCAYVTTQGNGTFVISSAS